MTLPPERQEPQSVGTARRWADLGPRIASSVVLAGVGVIDIWLGGLWFEVLVAIIIGIVIWEVARMLQARHPQVLGGVAAVCMLLVPYILQGKMLTLLLVPALVILGSVRRDRVLFLGFAAAILLAGFGLIQLRGAYPVIWLIWLVLVVIVTDVAGYFAGRLIGGPKFWPAISPKKTWAGTVAGWIGAGLVGLGIAVWTGSGLTLIVISIAVSLASQMGDIAESALKRRVGVKDSSNLLPGHGGFYDRFDGVIGASVFLLVIEWIGFFPPLGG